MTKKMILTVGLVLSCLICYCQSELGIKLGAGVSQLGYRKDQPLKPGPSVQAGLFYNKYFKEKHVFGIDLLHVQLTSRENIKYPNGGYKQYRILQYNLCLPIYYGYKLKSFILQGGIQFNYFHSGIIYYESYWPNSPKDEHTYRLSGSTLSAIELGPTVRIVWAASKKFSLEGSYFYRINRTKADHLNSWSAQQATVGIRYAILKKV